MNCIKRDGDFTFLNLNEFRFNHPFSIKIDNELITEYYKNDLSKHLVKKLSTLYKTTPNRIMLVNGGDAGLDVLVKFFKRDAIIKVPTYGAYKTLCELHDVNYTEVLKLDLCNDEKIIFICNPNNPTGEYMCVKQMALDNPNNIFVIDETYIEFSGYESMISCTHNIFVIRSMSKYYGLAGMRIGCIIGNVDQMRDYFNDKNVLDISKLCVLEVLKNEKYYASCAAELKKNKKKIIDVLDKKQIDYIDTDCNFICVKGVKNLTEAKAQKLIFRDISSRPTCDDLYRITIGNSNDTNKTISFLNGIDP